jgi:ABC-type antimicrobial peptide transport system permease subunit
MRVLQVRSSTPPERLGPRVQSEIHALAPDVPVTDIQTMTQALGSVGGYMLLRLGATQAGAMGLLGLLLALVGVYGVTSYGAAQRTHEIGIRMALGAASRDVLRMILGQSAVMVSAGVLAGVVGAVGAGRVLSRVLRMPNAMDPVVFAMVALLLASITLVACYLPARRAMRVSPTTALRHE